MSDDQDFEQKFQKLADDVCDIKTAVIGDEKFGQLGLVKRVSAIEAWKDNINLRIATIAGGGIVLAIVGKYILTGKF